MSLFDGDIFVHSQMLKKTKDIQYNVNRRHLPLFSDLNFFVVETT